MQLLEMGSTHSLHIWLAIPIIIRIFLDEYDPSGRVFHSPESRSVCCGIIVCCLLSTYLCNPSRRLNMEDDEEDLELQYGIKRRSFLSNLAESASNTIASSSSSMFRNALFISTLFWISWPLNQASVSFAVMGAHHSNNVCAAGDTQCRIANHYGPPICCISPAFCDARAHNWIYQQGGTAQAYKPDQPVKETICNATLIKEQKMRHKVASWPYSRSTRKSPPLLNVTLNLMRCTNQEEAQEEEPATQEGGPQHCCCRPLLAESENATIEIWQTRPDGTYSSLRAGSDEGECRAKWVASVDNPDEPLDSGAALTEVEFQTVAPGSTGMMGGLGPNRWEFSPYGPPVLHILVRPGVDGVKPLLVDVPVSIDAKTLQEKPFTWTDWRGAAWVKSKQKHPAYNVTSWEADVDSNSVSISVGLFLYDDKDYSVSYFKKLMCPSLFYALPSAFYLEPISVCGKYLLDYFDM
jgi:hypothetical protein